MRAFNRIAVIALLAALLSAGVLGVLYGFDLFGYRLADLARASNDATRAIATFFRDVESGSPSPGTVAILLASALVGLVLLLFELKPSPPRLVRLGRGIYATRKAVKEAVEWSVLKERSVLEADIRVKALRRGGAKVKVESKIRRGENAGAVASALRELLRNEVREGLRLPVGRPRVRVEEVDPRRTKARVK